MWLLSALAVFGGTRVAIGLRCWEANPFHKFRNKRQRGEGSRTAQAAGPLADRWRLSRHRNKAERILRKSCGAKSSGLPSVPAIPAAASALVIRVRMPEIGIGRF